MKKMHIDFENCFGIERMNYDFDFSDDNVYTIYAKNGLMKTSFTNVFQKIQEGKPEEIKDKIFGDTGKAIIEIDGKPIEKKDVFVIQSFEGKYEANISPLLVNNNIKNSLKDVLKARTNFLRSLEQNSGLKIKKTTGGKINYELEPQIINDFRFNEQSILLNLDALKNVTPSNYLKEVEYNSIFDDGVLKKIKSVEFQKGIKNFNVSSEKIYKSFDFLEKGKLTLPKLKDIRKALEKDSFFIKNNKIVLSGTNEITGNDELKSTISKIDESIKKLPELEIIENMLEDVKGSSLKDIIETHPEIVTLLDINKLDKLRTDLWSSYIQDNQVLFDDLYSKYKKLEKSIESIEIDDTKWKQCLKVFKDRFTVPFDMKVTNLKGAIIGESVPQIEFSFKKGERQETIDRNKLDELDTLSQGEKRALYLLNIIFDLEQIKESEEEKLLIIDDIADSFDYKNKYAIVEYLLELKEDKNFKLIILSHNFDFYRTVSSRMSIFRKNRLVASTNDGNINLEVEFYQNQPFEQWKKNLNTKNVLTLIPFVRNMIEYGKNRKKDSKSENDYMFLTSLLHEKRDSYNIMYKKLVPIYKKYIDKTSFQKDVKDSDIVINSLFCICDEITNKDNKLENKILLSMAIRLKAEHFMIEKIKLYKGKIEWIEKDDKKIVNKSGYSDDFLAYVDNTNNQTRELTNGYNQFGDINSKKIISEVNIMTPESIHLNSFMYEPIIDMDINELLNLYNEIKIINSQGAINQ